MGAKVLDRCHLLIGCDEKSDFLIADGAPEWTVLQALQLAQGTGHIPGVLDEHEFLGAARDQATLQTFYI
jgi:hypothetical protein